MLMAAQPNLMMLCWTISSISTSVHTVGVMKQQLCNNSNLVLCLSWIFYDMMSEYVISHGENLIAFEGKPAMTVTLPNIMPVKLQQVFASVTVFCCLFVCLCFNACNTHYLSLPSDSKDQTLISHHPETEEGL